jgi:hypothetical protein
MLSPFLPPLCEVNNDAKHNGADCRGKNAIVADALNQILHDPHEGEVKEPAEYRDDYVTFGVHCELWKKITSN